MENDNIERLSKGGLVLPKKLSKKEKERLESLGKRDVDALIRLCKKVGGPETDLRYVDFRLGRQTGVYEEG